jgi:hypothetical protein
MILWAVCIVITTVELLIEDSQAAFASMPCGSSTNLAATPLSNLAPASVGGQMPNLERRDIAVVLNRWPNK